MKPSTLPQATLRILLAAAVALGTVMSAQAEDRQWDATKVGGSEDSPYDIWTTANWNGAVGSGNHLHFAVSEKTYIKSTSNTQVGNDFDVDSGDFVFIGPLYFLCYKSNQANATSSVVKKGDWTIQDYGMRLGSSSGTTVTFTNESGNVSITGSKGDDSILSVASGANSTVTVVKEAGDWSVSKTFFIANGAGATGRFYNRGGNVSGNSLYGVCLGSKTGDARYAYLEISGGRITNTGGHLSIGDGDNPGISTVYVTGNGEYLVQAGYVRLGNRGAATLTIDQNGLVTASANGVRFCYNAGCVAGRDCFLNLNGGTLETKTVDYGSGSAAATFTFNGGVLKALQTGTLIAAHNNLAVKVGANGGVINADGHTLTIEEPFLEDSSSTGGGMTFKGGGSVTLAAGNTYSGKTTIEVGTTVVIPAPSAIIGGIAVTVPETAPADGVYSLLSITGEGTFPASVLTGVVVPTGSRLVLSSDSKSILCVCGNPDSEWIGGASGSLSVGANWSTGVVPTSGNCFIGNATAANLTVGDTFAATSITFPADTALVTIDGADAISGIEAIINLSALHHVFNCPVVCADGITPSITIGSSNYMTFAGGITMYNAPKTGGSVKDYWSGNVIVTTDDEQSYTTGGNYAWFASGTTYFAKLGCFDRVQIAEGATAVVERLVYDNCVRSTTSGGKTGWFNLVFDNGNGTIRTKEVKTSGDAVLFHSYADSDMVGGTIIAEKLTCGATVQTGGGFPYPVFMLNCGALSGGEISTDAFNGEGVWVIGPGGLSFPDTGVHARARFETSLGKSLGGRPAATLHSYADWTLMPHPNGRNVCALKIGSGNGGFLVIDTGHYAIGDAEYDSATSHTVTLDGMVTTGPMRVEGNGTVVFANEYNTFSGLTVTDTATVKVNALCTPGSGAITLGAGTKLALTAASNTYTLANTLNLPTGENEVATIRIDGTRLKSGNREIATVGTGATANVALDLAGTALTGRKASLEVNEGKLVLSIIPPGTVFLIR